MAKTILGIDIGHDRLKLALVRGEQVKKTVVVPMPKNVVREGRVVSTETMGEFLRNTLKENGIRCRDAALVLANEAVYVRTVRMPRMTAEQLSYNLPFEFRDYITEELKDYVFDYAMISDNVEAEGEESGSAMELMAVAAPQSLIEDARAMLRKAGMKLVKAAPTVCCYQALIRKTHADTSTDTHEYCILDLGFKAIRMYMFREDRHEVTRVLEVGMESLDRAIADAFNVDEHLAHTYLTTNYEDCQNQPYCQTAYSNISVELMRALKFYRLSNPDSQLADVWLVGGGAVIEPLRKSIADTLDIRLHGAEELLPGEPLEGSESLALAVGITLT